MLRKDGYGVTRGTDPESQRASRGGPGWLKASTRKAFSMLRYLHGYNSPDRTRKSSEDERRAENACGSPPVRPARPAGRADLGEGQEAGRDRMAEACDDPRGDDHLPLDRRSPVQCRRADGSGQHPIIDIECDSDEAEEEYESLWDGKPPVVPSYRGQRGRHYLFRWRPGFPDKAAFHCGALEVRTGNGGKGAQSVFPPSIHPSGAVYSWIEGLSLDDVPLGTLPDEIVAKLVVEETATAAEEKPRADPVRARPGRGDDTGTTLPRQGSRHPKRPGHGTTAGVSSDHVRRPRVRPGDRDRRRGADGMGTEGRPDRRARRVLPVERKGHQGLGEMG